MYSRGARSKFESGPDLTDKPEAQYVWLTCQSCSAVGQDPDPFSQASALSAKHHRSPFFKNNDSHRDYYYC